GYDTQVFLLAQKQPALASMAISMAALHSGFDPDDAELITTEVVLDGLQRGRNLISSEQMQRLLNSKFINPWLGILAAHALRLDPAPNQQLLATVLTNLQQILQLGDHPDLRALELQDGTPAPQPFPFPPMLQASLMLVRRHAARHPKTVPLRSLTSRLLDGLL